MRYSVSSPEGDLVVFSEVYDPAGWKFTLEDGIELIDLSRQIAINELLEAELGGST